MIEWVCPECQRVLSARGQEYHCCQCNFVLRNFNSVWSSSPEYLPSGFSETSRHHLAGLESKHFWFGGRKKLLERKIVSLIPDTNCDVLELGCGAGYLLKILENYANNVVGVDGHLLSLQEASTRTNSAMLLHSDISSLPFSDNRFDFICAFDVLEHVSPQEFYSEVNRLLKPCGKILLTVPAFSLLWSAVDENAGHRCRYSFIKAREELRAGGFKVLGKTHYQFFLFPLIWATRKLVSSKGRSDTEAQPPRRVNYLLDKINQLEVKMFSKRSLPYGSSLVIWAEVLK